MNSRRSIIRSPRRRARARSAVERKQIVDAMAASQIPAIYPFREYSAAGGLIVYGANISSLFERAAGYVDRVLKGEKPANLPVQPPNSIVSDSKQNGIRARVHDRTRHRLPRGYSVNFEGIDGDRQLLGATDAAAPP
jgi:hypothetical protein